jgi:glucose/arabinose dehydrogenase
VVAIAGCGGGDQTTTGHRPPAQTGPVARHPPATGDGRGGVELRKVGDFEQPVYVTQPPGDRRDLFVVEQTGRVVVVRDGEPLPRPFLDLSDRVSCCGEQGLLSLAFAPDYPDSGLLYVDYTDVAGDTRVVEYQRATSDPPTADPASARQVLAVDQPYSNHNGGLVVFGPDGDLYVGLGDGGSEGDPDRVGQDLSTLLAKILRIDPHASGGKPYTIPGDNPFAGKAGARREIWAYGLRNPWRFSFDVATGTIAIGDVGQNEFEEVDLAPHYGAGDNFGWSAFEGEVRYNDDQSAPGAISPVLTYTHDEGCSITGGYIVRDRSLPSLYGRYLYGDYCSGQLRSFVARSGAQASDDRPLGPTVDSLSSFGIDDAGHLYAVSLDGPVYRLARAGSE